MPKLLGRTDGGWLVFEENDDNQGIQQTPATASSPPSGSSSNYLQNPYLGSVEVQALSPDGTTFASGGALIDLSTRQVIGKTPSNARFASDLDYRKACWYFDSQQRAPGFPNASAPHPFR